MDTEALQKTRQIIDKLDLTPVINRLVQLEGFTHEEATMASEQYRNFLYLQKKYGDEFDLPPSTDIDEVWHAHILHTKDYMNFCHEVYGEYLHHQPGSEKDPDSEKFHHLFEAHTQHLYHQEFGDYIYAVRSRFFLKNILFYFKKLARK